MNTSAKARCATSRRGTRGARRSSTAAPPKTASTRSNQLVEQFMSQHPYRRAQRVFLIIDNGSAHRGKRSIDRLQGTWPNMTVVHTPIQRLLGQPGRDLLLRRATQSRNPQQLRRPRHPPTTATRLRPPRRADRRTVPMEVHPARPPQAPRQDRRPTHLPRRLTPSTRYVRELPSQTTKRLARGQVAKLLDLASPDPLGIRGRPRVAELRQRRPPRLRAAEYQRRHDDPANASPPRPSRGGGGGSARGS